MENTPYCWTCGSHAPCGMGWFTWSRDAPRAVSGLNGLGFGRIRHRACHRHRRGPRVVFAGKPPNRRQKPSITQTSTINLRSVRLDCLLGAASECDPRIVRRTHRKQKWNKTGCVQLLLSDSALFERYQSTPNRRGKRKVRIAILSV